MFRAILAGLFFFACVIGLVILISSIPGDPLSRPASEISAAFYLLMFVVIGVIFCVLLWVSNNLFNTKHPKPSRLKQEPAPEKIDQLIKQGLVTTTDYKATDAFQVKEYEDEGLHYFIKLDDNKTLYLTGQWLYEYEPDQSNKKSKQQRKFPCTEFSIREDRSGEHGIDIACRGTVIEPVLIDNGYLLEWYDSNDPGDNDLIADRTYEDLKQAFEAGAKSA